MGEYSFTEYVMERCQCKSKLVQGVVSLLRRQPEVLDLETADTVDLVFNQIVIDSLVALDTPGSVITFYATLSIHAYAYESSQGKSFTKVVYAKCQGDMAENLSDLKVLSLLPFLPVGEGLLLGDDLLPKCDYVGLEERALNFVQKYVPAILQSEWYGGGCISVDPMQLAHRLGLTVIEHGICKDISIFGQIYFQDGRVSLYDKETDSLVTQDVQAGTIVWDPAVIGKRNQGAANNTIIHECVHWVYHAKAFWLEKAFESGKLGVESAFDSTSLLEKQANQLTPRIQMPKPVVMKQLKKYKDLYLENFGRKNLSQMMPWVIDKLARDFDVSKQAVRIRLLQLGCMEADGACVYLDGEHVMPYAFREGSLKEHQTFSISWEMAMAEMRRNKTFRELTETGCVLFVDHHFTLFDKKYVEKNEVGRLVMTAYALNHMEECCLIFNVWYEGWYASDEVGQEAMNHQMPDVKEQTTCFDRQNVIDDLARADVIWRESQFYISHMTGDPKQCLLFLMQQKESDFVIAVEDQKKIEYYRKRIAQYEKELLENPADSVIINKLENWKTKLRNRLFECLHQVSGVASNTIKRMMKREVETQIENVALVCLAMHLLPKVSLYFIKVLGCYYNPNSVYKHSCIEFVLNALFEEPIGVSQKYIDTIFSDNKKV